MMTALGMLASFVLGGMLAWSILNRTLNSAFHEMVKALNDAEPGIGNKINKAAVEALRRSRDVDSS